jgi:hypothetical protein
LLDLGVRSLRTGVGSSSFGLSPRNRLFDIAFIIYAKTIFFNFITLNLSVLYVFGFVSMSFFTLLEVYINAIYACRIFLYKNFLYLSPEIRMIHINK